MEIEIMVNNYEEKVYKYCVNRKKKNNNDTNNNYISNLYVQ